MKDGESSFCELQLVLHRQIVSAVKSHSANLFTLTIRLSELINHDPNHIGRSGTGGFGAMYSLGGRGLTGC